MPEAKEMANSQVSSCVGEADPMTIQGTWISVKVLEELRRLWKTHF